MKRLIDFIRKNCLIEDWSGISKPSFGSENVTFTWRNWHNKSVRQRFNSGLCGSGVGSFCSSIKSFMYITWSGGQNHGWKFWRHKIIKTCLCVQLNTLNTVAYLIYLYSFNFLRLFSSPWKVSKTALEIFLKLFLQEK